MEFEDNQPTDDEQRRLAETRKITLQPLHAGITPDPIPDAEIAARNTQEISPNTSNDSEDTSTIQLIQPSKSALDKTTKIRPAVHASSNPSAIILLVAVFVAIGATVWLWTRAA